MPNLPLFVILCDQLRISPSWLLLKQLEVSSTEDTNALIAFYRSLSPTQILLITSMIQSTITRCPADAK